MKLEKLLQGVSFLEVKGSTDLEINAVEFDSRKIVPQSLFVAQTGTQVNGHDFIEIAIEKGASAVVCEILPETIHSHVTCIQVQNSAIALGQIAAAWYDHPTDKLKLIGITGTNGKTTTATLTYNLLESLGCPAVLISTIRILIHGQAYDSSHTTPDILTINKILSQAVEMGCEYAVMEVSSHGIHQDRIAGLKYQIAVFSNITHDHLDYHKTFAEYIKAKKKFFDNLSKDAHSLTNIDDKNGVVMLQNTVSHKHSYALKTDADFKAKILENQFDGMLLNIDGQEIWTSLIGQFNAYNLLAVYSIAKLLGFDKEEILTHLSKLKNVDGRFETFKSPGGIVAIVDYAHTPDALGSVLNTIQNIRTKNEKLITVVGCGGDRDKTKRPEMGQIAAKNSDLVIFTSDNPRSEDPEEILREIEAGVEPQYYNRTLKITDRKEAIKTAYKMAESGDIILIAGKGHETYQEVKGVRHHFDDREIAREISNQLNK